MLDVPVPAGLHGPQTPSVTFGTLCPQTSSVPINILTSDSSVPLIYTVIDILRSIPFTVLKQPQFQSVYTVLRHSSFQLFVYTVLRCSPFNLVCTVLRDNIVCKYSYMELSIEFLRVHCPKLNKLNVNSQTN